MLYFFLFCLLLIFLIYLKKRTPLWPLSDHCNGKKFYNSPPCDRNFFQVLRWFWSRSATPWPEHRSFPPCKDIEMRVQNSLKVTFINHATILIQWKGKNILTDPIWAERCSPFKNLGPKRIHKPGMPLDSLPQIDLILLSHNHYDHMDLDTLQWIIKRDKAVIFTGLGNKSYLNKNGISPVVELDWWQKTFYLNFEIIFTPASHFSARWPWDRNRTLWGGFLLESQGQYIYFAGDTGFSQHFETIRQRFGPPLLSFLPIGAYAPRWFMEPFHLNPSDALRAFEILESRFGLAIHHGTFPLTDEGVDDPANFLKEEMQKKSITEERFWILSPGQSQSIKDDSHV